MNKTVQKVIIVGVPRSGTTLLAAMLGQHDDIYVMEDAISERIVGILDHLEQRYDGHLPNSIKSMWNKEVEVDKRLFSVIGTVNSEPASLSSLINDAIDTRTRDNLATIFIDKCPPAIEHLSVLQQIYKEPFTIQVIRDPRSTIASLMKRQYMSFLDAAVYWVNLNRKGLVHRDLVGSRHLTVQYEDLVRSPESTLETLCDAIGISYSDSMTKLDGSKLTDSPDAYVKTRIAQDKVDSWRGSLSEKQVKRTEKICGNLMAHFGYIREFPDSGTEWPGPLRILASRTWNAWKLLFRPKRTVMTGGKLIEVRMPLRKRMMALLSTLLRGTLSEPIIRTLLRGKTVSERRQEWNENTSVPADQPSKRSS